MSAGEEAGDDAPEHVVLADDDGLDLAQEVGKAVLQGFEVRLRVGDRHARAGKHTAAGRGASQACNLAQSARTAARPRARAREDARCRRRETRRRC